MNHSWHRRNKEGSMEMGGGGRIKKIIAFVAVGVLAGGIIIHLFLTVN